MNVVYLGNLFRVAEALAAIESVSFLAWIFEEEDLGIPEIQHAKGLFSGKTYTLKKRADLIPVLKKIGPFDLGVMANFGLVLKAEELAIPRAGYINAHLGLLPEYPGRYPIQKALKNSEKITGVTLHWVTEKVDQGPVIDRAHIAVPPNRDPLDTFERLEQQIIEIIRKNLPQINLKK